MYVLSLTSFGVSRRLLTYQRMSDALIKASLTSSTEADKSQIYKVSGDGRHGDPSVVGLSRGVFVGAVDSVALNQLAGDRGPETAKAQLLAAMTPGLLEEGQEDVK